MGTLVLSEENKVRVVVGISPELNERIEEMQTLYREVNGKVLSKENALLFIIENALEVLEKGVSELKKAKNQINE